MLSGLKNAGTELLMHGLKSSLRELNKLCGSLKETQDWNGVITPIYELTEVFLGFLRNPGEEQILVFLDFFEEKLKKNRAYKLALFVHEQQPDEKTNNENLEAAKKHKMPILIKIARGKYILYGKRDNEWQPTTLENLSREDISALEKLPFPEGDKQSTEMIDENSDAALISVLDRGHPLLKGTDDIFRYLYKTLILDVDYKKSPQLAKAVKKYLSELRDIFFSRIVGTIIGSLAEDIDKNEVKTILNNAICLIAEREDYDIPLVSLKATELTDDFSALGDVDPNKTGIPVLIRKDKLINNKPAGFEYYVLCYNYNLGSWNCLSVPLINDEEMTLLEQLLFPPLKTGLFSKDILVGNLKKTKTEGQRFQKIKEIIGRRHHLPQIEDQQDQGQELEKEKEFKAQEPAAVQVNLNTKQRKLASILGTEEVQQKITQEVKQDLSTPTASSAASTTNTPSSTSSLGGREQATTPSDKTLSEDSRLSHTFTEQKETAVEAQETAQTVQPAQNLPRLEEKQEETVYERLNEKEEKEQKISDIFVNEQPEEESSYSASLPVLSVTAEEEENLVASSDEPSPVSVGSENQQALPVGSSSSPSSPSSSEEKAQDEKKEEDELLNQPLIASDKKPAITISIIARGDEAQNEQVQQQEVEKNVEEEQSEVSALSDQDQDQEEYETEEDESEISTTSSSAQENNDAHYEYNEQANQRLLNTSQVNLLIDQVTQLSPRSDQPAEYKQKTNTPVSEPDYKKKYDSDVEEEASSSVSSVISNKPLNISAGDLVFNEMKKLMESWVHKEAELKSASQVFTEKLSKQVREGVQKIKKQQNARTKPSIDSESKQIVDASTEAYLIANTELERRRKEYHTKIKNLYEGFLKKRALLQDTINGTLQGFEATLGEQRQQLLALIRSSSPDNLSTCISSCNDFLNSFNTTYNRLDTQHAELAEMDASLARMIELARENGWDLVAGQENVSFDSRIKQLSESVKGLRSTLDSANTCLKEQKEFSRFLTEINTEVYNLIADSQQRKVILTGALQRPDITIDQLKTEIDLANNFLTDLKERKDKLIHKLNEFRPRGRLRALNVTLQEEKISNPPNYVGEFERQLAKVTEQLNAVVPDFENELNRAKGLINQNEINTRVNFALVVQRSLDDYLKERHKTFNFADLIGSGLGLFGYKSQQVKREEYIRNQLLPEIAKYAQSGSDRSKEALAKKLQEGITSFKPRAKENANPAAYHKSLRFFLTQVQVTLNAVNEQQAAPALDAEAKEEEEVPERQQGSQPSSRRSNSGSSSQ